MRPDPSEIVQTDTKRVTQSPNPRCTIVRPFSAELEYIADHVEGASYWSAFAEEIGDSFGTGDSVDAAIADMLDSFLETLDWYEQERVQYSNDLMREDYDHILSYIKPLKGHRR